MQRKQLKTAVKICVDTLLPPRCIISGDIVEAQGMLSGRAWGALDFIADPMCVTCGIPFEFGSDIVEMAQGMVCAPCLNDKPPFHMHRAALAYNDTSRDLILSFKHGDHTHLVRGFVPLLMNAVKDIIGDADIIMPVPLHHWRIVARRYNQSALLAQEFARQIGKKYLADGLIRTRATPTQGHLKVKERIRNVRKAFAVSEQHRQGLSGKHVIVIDDVYTTGATLRECTKMLLKSGASKVSCLTLARVVK